jgi:hypothetical protein
MGRLRVAGFEEPFLFFGGEGIAGTFSGVLGQVLSGDSSS